MTLGVETSSLVREGEFLSPTVDKPMSRSRPAKLLDRSRRTEQTYCQWVKRYIFFHKVRHPAEMAEPEINAFLTHLAVQEKVSASTQNQALSAILFLYRHVLQRNFGQGSNNHAARVAQALVARTPEARKADPRARHGRRLEPRIENIQTPRRIGAGNGSFPRKTDGATPRPAKRGGITSMSRLCRRRCVRR